MDYTSLVIETNRLKLVPVSLEYLDQIYIYFDAEVTKYMYPAPAKELSDSFPFILSSNQKMKDGIDFTYVILKKDNLEFLGCGGVHGLNQEYPEFGIWTKMSSHGNHFGFEAVEASFHHFKNQFKGFIYPVDKANIPSKRIALKLGGKLHKEYTHENQSGVILNIEEYLIPSNGLDF